VAMDCDCGDNVPDDTGEVLSSSFCPFPGVNVDDEVLESNSDG
jgi:hypothetical protein